VFTARYALSPYIKQIRFVFRGLRRRVIYGGIFQGEKLRLMRCESRYIVFNIMSCLGYAKTKNRI
jgi:hypothetical protein